MVAQTLAAAAAARTCPGQGLEAHAATSAQIETDSCLTGLGPRYGEARATALDGGPDHAGSQSESQPRHGHAEWRRMLEAAK